jgi:hypothetical protein
MISWERPSLSSLESIKDLHNCMSVLGKRLLHHLYIHLGLVFLHTEVGMFFKPPRNDGTLTDTTQLWRRSWVTIQFVGTCLCKLSEVFR